MFEQRQKPVTKWSYSLGKLILLVLLLFLAVIWSKKNLMHINEQLYDRLYLNRPAEQTLRLGGDEDTAKMVRVQRKVYHEVYPEVLCMRLDSDALSRTVMSEGDYTPQDIAVYLMHLQKSKLQALAFSSPLQWELPADDMGLQALVMSLSKQTHYALGLRAQTAAMADFTPDVLADSVIPLDHVKGDISALPSANKLMPNALQNALSMHWAVDSIVGERQMENPSLGSKKSYPLFVRWNGEIYPTLPLVLAMDVLQLKSKDVYITLGEEVQLGSRKLTLDDAGRCPLPDVTHREILLEDFVDGTEDANLAGKVMVLEHQPEGARSNAGRLGNLSETLSYLLAEQEVELVEEQQVEQALVLRAMSWRHHKQLYLILLSSLALWILIMPLLSRSMLYTAYVVGIPAASAVLFYWSHANGMWVNWSCIVCVSLVLLLFSPLRWKKAKKRR